MSSQDSNQTSRPHLSADLPISQIQQLLRQQSQAVDSLNRVYDVRYTAVLPHAWVDENGMLNGDSGPMFTTQTVDAIASDGSRVSLFSRSRQDDEHEPLRVRASSITVADAQGRMQYAVELNTDGSVRGTGRAANIRLRPDEVVNLANYFDNITDNRTVSGADIDRALDMFRRTSGIQR